VALAQHQIIITYRTGGGDWCRASCGYSRIWRRSGAPYNAFYAYSYTTSYTSTQAICNDFGVEVYFVVITQEVPEEHHGGFMVEVHLLTLLVPNTIHYMAVAVAEEYTGGSTTAGGTSIYGGNGGGYKCY
jgi:hypothetical protein